MLNVTKKKIRGKAVKGGREILGPPGEGRGGKGRRKEKNEFHSESKSRKE